MNTQDREFWKQYFVFMFVLLRRVFTNARLVILAMICCVYVCVVVEGLYTCNNGNFGNKHFCLFLCCCIGHVHM